MFEAGDDELRRMEWLECRRGQAQQLLVPFEGPEWSKPIEEKPDLLD